MVLAGSILLLLISNLSCTLLYSFHEPPFLLKSIYSALTFFLSLIEFFSCATRSSALIRSLYCIGYMTYRSFCGLLLDIVALHATMTMTRTLYFSFCKAHSILMIYFEKVIVSLFAVSVSALLIELLGSFGLWPPYQMSPRFTFHPSRIMPQIKPSSTSVVCKQVIGKRRSVLQSVWKSLTWQ